MTQQVKRWRVSLFFIIIKNPGQSATLSLGEKMVLITDLPLIVCHPSIFFPGCAGLVSETSRTPCLLLQG